MSLSLAAACGDDVGTTTDGGTTGTTGTTGDMTTNPTTNPTTPTTTNPTTDATTADSTTSTTDTTNPTTGITTDVTVGTTDVSTTDVSTTDVSTSGSTSDGSTSGSTGGSTSDSSTGGSSTGMGDLCFDGMIDQDETDVDCGGAICGPCADGLACLVNEDCQSQSCVGGVCIAPPECMMDADCAGKGDACNDATCDPNTFQCVVTPKMDGDPCVGNDLCNVGALCNAGVCEGGAPKDCSGMNTVCGLGVCEPGTGNCIVEGDKDKEGQACDDGNACTANTVCADGQCGDPNDKGYVFYESFANNDAGWTLAQSWEIKPAAASPAGFNGADPANDHTPSMDNGVAGQFVGALVTSQNTTTGQFNCLTSPKIDTSAMPTVWWTFWRHLHTDYTSFVVNRVEVFDGNAWVTLQQGYPNPGINDANWTEQKFDITQYKNANMQVRICHQRNGGAFSHAGWSVDDVTIAPVSCTP